MSQPLHVLLVEDNPQDAELVLRELRNAGFEPVWQRVETEEEYLRYLDAHSDLEIILSDYQMPQFSGFLALELLKKRGLDIPFVLISGTIGEDIAVEAMKLGAEDYFLKDRLTRLGPAVHQVLEQSRLRLERKLSQEALQESENTLRRDRALLRALIDSIPDLIFFKDQDSRFLGFNKAFEEQFGYTRKNLIGLTDYDIVSQELAESYRSKDHDLFVSGETQRTEDWIPFHSGGGGFFETVKTPYYGPEGESLGLVGVSRDITERRRVEAALEESELRYRSLFENMVEGPTALLHLADSRHHRAQAG